MGRWSAALPDARGGRENEWFWGGRVMHTPGPWPDLLTALKALLEALAMVSNGRSTDDSHYERLDRAEFAARAAVAKAEQS